MNKFYKIKIDKSKNIADSILTFEKLGDFCLSRDFVYIFSKHSAKLFEKNGFCTEALRDSDVDKIDSALVKQWYTQKRIAEQLCAFEQSDECQKRLKEINEYLDLIENGGGIVAENKESTGAGNKSESSDSD